MPKGQLTINGKDAFTEWGISFDESALSALMTPPPNKEMPENKSRALDGKTILDIPRRMDERDVTLTFHLIAPDKATFIRRYAAFCKELAKGKLIIASSLLDDKPFIMEYVSCNQFTQFMRGIAKFSLKLNEPNPALFPLTFE